MHGGVNLTMYTQLVHIVDDGSQALVVPHDTSADLEEQSGRISPGKNKLH